MFMKKEVVISLAAGLLLGKAGKAIFGGETARKVYTKAATGVYIAKDAIMEEAEKVQAGAMDIAADARIEADKYQAKKDAEFAAFGRAKDKDMEVTDQEKEPVEA